MLLKNKPFVPTILLPLTKTILTKFYFISGKLNAVLIEFGNRNCKFFLLIIIAWQIPNNN